MRKRFRCTGAGRERQLHFNKVCDLNVQRHLRVSGKRSRCTGAGRERYWHFNDVCTVMIKPQTLNLKPEGGTT